MVFSPKMLWSACFLGIALTMARADVVLAGWMGYKNETNDAIVIQETIVVNGQQKPGRPQRLEAGQSTRDTQCQGTQKQISIFNPKNPNTALFTGNLACPGVNENILYIIRSDGKGGITLQPVKAPVVPPKK
jgi:hypothetical protein